MDFAFKKLKFTEPLPELILSGEKDTTWRVKDDKRIQEGDFISLCTIHGNEFAIAEVTSVKETDFGHITEEDMDGHEEFNSTEEMYQTYSKYYNIKVTPQTQVKIIKFRLI